MQQSIGALGYRGQLANSFQKIGESIIIGNLCVTVIGVFNKKVPLGIVNQKEKSGFSNLEGKLEAVITIPENVKIIIIQIRRRQVRLAALYA
jgi:sRNA-binding carbon storage regulator CsrA